MPKMTKYADHLIHWETLLAALEQNGDSLPHLALPRERLQALLAEARGALTVQAVHVAAKQEAGRKLTAALDKGGKLATFLRTGIREHYGNRSEKLAEFRIQPFRGRPRPVEPPPQPEIAAPSGADR